MASSTKPPAPARARDLEGLLCEVEDIQTRCRAKVRNYVTNGEERSYEDPDHKTELAGTALKAQLLGHLGKGDNMTFETLKRELEAMGFELKPIRKLKAVGKQSG